MNCTKTKFYLTLTLAAAFALSGCATQTSNPLTVKAASESPAVESGDPKINQILKYIEKSPDTPEGYDQLAVAYIKKARETGDFGLNSKAQTAIEKALQVAPQDASGKRLQASLHLTYHRFAEALELGKKLQNESPTDAFVYGILTDANFELGNYEEAVAAAQKMMDLKPNTASFARTAHLRSFYGDTNGAVEAYTTAARTADPLDREAQSWCLVQIGDEYWKYGKYEKAEKVYDEALANFPDYYLALAAKGKIRAAQNDFDGAVKILTEANNRVPNVETAILLGDVYTKLGNPEKAKQQYDLVELIERKIGVNNDQKRLAVMWADQNVRLDDALEITTREAGMRKDVLTADALAWTLYKKGRLNEAQAAIKDALKLKSNDARTMYHAGMIAKDAGDKPEAKKMLEAALKLNPAFDLIQADAARRALSEL